jgi:hypothetical protein
LSDGGSRARRGYRASARARRRGVTRLRHVRWRTERGRQVQRASTAEPHSFEAAAVAGGAGRHDERAETLRCTDLRLRRTDGRKKGLPAHEGWRGPLPLAKRRSRAHKGRRLSVSANCCAAVVAAAPGGCARPPAQRRCQDLRRRRERGRIKNLQVPHFFAALGTTPIGGKRRGQTELEGWTGSRRRQDRRDVRGTRGRHPLGDLGEASNRYGGRIAGARGKHRDGGTEGGRAVTSGVRRRSTRTQWRRWGGGTTAQRQRSTGGRRKGLARRGCAAGRWWCKGGGAPHRHVLGQVDGRRERQWRRGAVKGEGDDGGDGHSGDNERWRRTGGDEDCVGDVSCLKGSARLGCRAEEEPRSPSG